MVCVHVVRAISPHIYPTTTQAMGLFPKKGKPPPRKSTRHAGSEGKEEAVQPRSAPGNAHLKTVKDKLKDAIDNVHLYSDSGSGSDDTDDDEPIAAKPLQKKADDSESMTKCQSQKRYWRRRQTTAMTKCLSQQHYCRSRRRQTYGIKRSSAIGTWSHGGSSSMQAALTS
jgi:hypothetical protein